MQWPLVGREAALGQVWELVQAGTGVAILGPAGVGKSRLLHELAERAGQSGKTVVTAVASESTRSIPLAPFVGLLPAGPTQDRLSMLGVARSSLAARAGARGLLLTIDDAHHLDETSLAFLGTTVNAGVGTVAITARTGEQMAPDLVDLWTNGVVERIDVAPLDKDDARLLVETTLGPVSSELESELWRLAEGNPLILHELIEGAVDGSIVRDENGIWIQIGSIAESPRLSDLVGSRLKALPEDLRRAMGIVAVGSPLPLQLAHEAIGDGLADLEDRDLVRTTGRDPHKELIPAHPLYGEILKAHIGDLRSRAAYRQLVLAADSAGTVPDPLRPALWQRDSGETFSTELALAGAQEALVRHDPGLAEELLRPLGTDDDRIALMLGRALSYRQQFEEAEQVLADREPANAEVFGEMISIRAQNMAFGLGRLAEARRLLQEGAGGIEDSDLRARLTNERAMVSAIQGDFVDTMSASDAVLSDPDTSVLSRAAAYVSLTVALAMTGDCVRMEEVIEEALEVTERARAILPLARDQVEIMQMSSLLNAGRIGEAVDLCESVLECGGRGAALVTTWRSASGIAYELSGRLSSSVASVEEALPLFAQADPFGLEPQARGLLASSLGQMGHPEAAEPLRQLPPLIAGSRLTIWISRGRAWSAVAAGDVVGGARFVAEGGRDGMAGEHYAWATFCFLDAVRLGFPDLVIDELRQIDTSRGAHFLAAVRDYAEALVENDSAELELIAGRFARFGAHLIAADIFAQASSLFERSDDGARCAALSMAAQSLCEEPLTPAISARPALVSPREIEVALDAVAGMTSPQISEKRYISVRTVDNHLSSVYRKLAISGRDELSNLLSSFVGAGSSTDGAR